MSKESPVTAGMKIKNRSGEILTVVKEDGPLILCLDSKAVETWVMKEHSEKV